MQSSIVITDSAAKRILALMAEKQAPNAGLRLAVKGGGCSGLTLTMDVVEAPKERDKAFEHQGARVYVESKSLLYIGGSVLDYYSTLMASGFRLQNPNKKTECGCGESFSI